MDNGQIHIYRGKISKHFLASIKDRGNEFVFQDEVFEYECSTEFIDDVAVFSKGCGIYRAEEPVEAFINCETI